MSPPSCACSACHTDDFSFLKRKTCCTSARTGSAASSAPGGDAGEQVGQPRRFEVVRTVHLSGTRGYTTKLLFFQRFLRVTKIEVRQLRFRCPQLRLLPWEGWILRRSRVSGWILQIRQLQEEQQLPKPRCMWVGSVSVSPLLFVPAHPQRAVKVADNEDNSTFSTVFEHVGKSALCPRDTASRPTLAPGAAIMDRLDPGVAISDGCEDGSDSVQDIIRGSFLHRAPLEQDSGSFVQSTARDNSWNRPQKLWFRAP